MVDGLSEPGHPDRANEDAFGACGAYAWVIDGATGLAETPLLDAPSDAAWLAAALGAALAALAHDAPDPAALLVAAAAEVEARFHAERIRAPRERYEIPTASVLLARFAGEGIDLVELGDCGLYVAAEGAVARYGGSARGRAGERSSAARLNGATRRDDPDVLAFLRAARNRANAPGGYPIFAPDADAARHARRHHHAAPSGEALFVTDGFDAAVEDYCLYSPASLVNAARGGLPGPLAAIRAAERDDPEGLRYPRFKPSDDATALLVRFGDVQVG